MANIEFDNTSGRYRIRFRFAGRGFKRSLGTASIKLARGRLARVEETLALIANDRLEVPEDVDPAEFILSDGKRSQPKIQKRVITLGELCQMFQTQRVPGAKEASTIRTEDLHIRTLLRVLKKSTFVQSIRNADLQDYVLARLSPNNGRKPVAADTIHKELATLRVIWNWAMRRELLDRPAPIAGLEYPKRDERHPFRTWDEITSVLARGAITSAEERELWESLYLSRNDVHDALQYAKSNAKHPFIYPLLVFVAHTGVRVSEALRSQIEDLDFKAGRILIREKKRSRIRATTFRQVEMTSVLKSVLKEWLAVHPGTLFTFAKGEDLNRGRQSYETIVPIDKHVARKHFKLTFRGSKWAKLRGYHIFRHSFASNLASVGVDQRIIDEWMGHQTDEMRRRYRHLLPEVRHEAIQKLLPDGALPTTGEVANAPVVISIA
ncbi:MAG TPA: site-specific integrase [Hyphomicrobium sp.]|nr:site-specific integrase [Hyphomicrobium sp.]